MYKITFYGMQECFFGERRRHILRKDSLISEYDGLSYQLGLLEVFLTGRECIATKLGR